jgi:GT2 family glycosyltransferase
MDPLLGRIGIVVLTHNRKHELLRTVSHLVALEGRVPIVVVDNASSDGTTELVEKQFPEVTVVRLTRNLGAAGRNVGVLRVVAPYVAFCDDDTWWEPGSLSYAADLLDRYPRLAAVTARVLVGADQIEDPTSTRMAASPLENQLGVPGQAVIGFLAGACVLRRTAFLAAGGFHPRFFLGMEEALLAIDFMTAGWSMAYVPEVVVHHHPSAKRNAAARRRLISRNALWCAWLRRPPRSAFKVTARLLREVLDDPSIASGVGRAMLGWRWVLRERRVIPPMVEDALQRVEAFYRTPQAGGEARRL